MPLDRVRTEAFSLLAMCQWFNVPNCGSVRRSMFALRVPKSRWLLGGLVLSMLLQLLVL